MKTHVLTAIFFLMLSVIGNCQESSLKKFDPYRIKLADHVSDLNSYLQAFTKNGNPEWKTVEGFFSIALKEGDRCTGVCRLLIIQENLTTSLNATEKKALKEFVYEIIKFEAESMDVQIKYLIDILPHSKDNNVTKLANQLKSDLRELRALYKDFPKP